LVVSSAVGNAGEYLVMAELLLRGFDAYLAGRENPAFDIACFCSASGRATRLRVKTTTDGRAKWSTKKDGSLFRNLQPNDDYVVIVNLVSAPSYRQFYVVPTTTVEQDLCGDFEFYVSQIGPTGKTRKNDSRARFMTFDMEEKPTDRGYGYAKKYHRYKDAWDSLR
jgi:hypothetical protein